MTLDPEPVQNERLDAARLRQVFGHFPTGVTVVTGTSERGPVGLTIGSFTSISLVPPLVGFLPQIGGATWASIADTGMFCINALRHEQADLCWRFARSDPDEDRFRDIGWTTSPSGCPIIDGVGAWIDCALEHSFELGDHLMVVGQVLDLAHDVEPHTPLLFYKGALGGFLAAD